MEKRKVVLITGSAKGIGKAIALELAKNSYDIVINYHHSKNEALALNKDIYCIPYPYDDISGQGCNLLIQQGSNIFLLNNLNDIFDKSSDI